LGFIGIVVPMELASRKVGRLLTNMLRASYIYIYMCVVYRYRHRYRHIGI
jgi:hypothetical protein